jgi:LmbE family N-acetylglucosaminyl deacetylase
VCATYGEKGKSHLPKPVSDEALKEIRMSELLKAAKILKIDEVLFLDLPDAGVRDHEEELFEKCLKIVQHIEPDYLLSFGPDGMSGHWDHITVGKAALRVAKQLGIPMLAFTISPEFRAARRAEAFLQRRKFGSYIEGAPEHRESDVVVKVDLGIKRKAWSSHKSQFGDAGGPLASLPKGVAKTMFGDEHFVKEHGL